MERKLYILYEKGMLSERLSKNIDRKLTNLKIPTEAEIKEAESFDSNPRDIGSIVDVPYSIPEGKAIKITNNPLTDDERIFSVFTTIDNSIMINIGGRKYPTIIHYNLASRIAAIPSIKTIKNAYVYLLEDPNVAVEGIGNFLHFQTVFNEYNKLNTINLRERLISVMEIGLNKKFENREFQDVLLSTKNSSLIWNDYSAPILGAGKDGKGDNLVGKYLMQIRTMLKEERKDEKIEALSLDDITKILENDPFLMKWLQMRINDMCRSIIVMKQYVDDKTFDNTELTPKFVSSVLNNIYYSCSHFFTTISQVKIPAPEFFINIVRRFQGFQKVNKDVIQEIWLRIAVIFYYLIKYLDEVNVYDIRKVLSGIEQMVTKSNDCVRLVNKTEDNCIVSALINLMLGISAFNKTMGEDSTITKNEVGISASIILNKDVTEQLDPKVISVKSEDMVDKLEIYDIEGITKQQKKKKQYVGTTGYPQWDDDIQLPTKRDEILEDDERDILEDIEDDDTDEEGEQDYGEIGEFDEDLADEYSPKQNPSLLRFLQNLEESGYKIDDPEGIMFYIEGAIDIIKSHKMSTQVKNNRINFFATQN